jgi:hypothetical protein
VVLKHKQIKAIDRVVMKEKDMTKTQKKFVAWSSISLLILCLATLAFFLRSTLATAGVKISDKLSPISSISEAEKNFGKVVERRLQGSLNGNSIFLDIFELHPSAFEAMIDREYKRNNRIAAVAFLVVKSNPLTVFRLVGEKFTNDLVLRFDHKGEIGANVLTAEAEEDSITIEGLSLQGILKLQSASKDWPIVAKQGSIWTGEMVTGSDNSPMDVYFINFTLESFEKNSINLQAGLLSISWQFKRRAILSEEKRDNVSPETFTQLLNALMARRAMFETSRIQDETQRGLVASPFAALPLVEENFRNFDFTTYQDIIVKYLGASRLNGICTGDQLIEIGKGIYGNWSDTISGTCHQPKTFTTPLVAEIEGDHFSYYGFQYDVTNQKRYRELHFSLESQTAEHSVLAMTPGTPGWKKPVVLTQVQNP